MGISRRQFLTIAASAAGGAAFVSIMENLRPLTAAEASQLTSVRDASVKKWIWVIDLEKCNGCAKCTEACTVEMRVPPAWGEPQYEGYQPWIQVFSTVGTDQRAFFMPVPCQNCQNAPCVKVCPVGANYYSEDGIVLVDQIRCVGTRICIGACPYQRRFFNWFDPPVSEEETSLPYSPDYNIPHRRGVVEKCIWCRHRIVDGKVPACVEGCAKAGMKVLWFGDAAQDAVSDGEEVVRLSQMIKDRGAYRLKEDLGTDPRVLYLPPQGGSA